MKQTIINITAATIAIFISFAAFAQQADMKPKIDESNKANEQDKTTITAPGPQITFTPKATIADEQPKPIVPGGEFKPMDTQNLVLPKDKKTVAENYQPIIPPVSTTAAPPPPVVKELNTDAATEQKAKPVPQVLKEQ